MGEHEDQCRQTGPAYDVLASGGDARKHNRQAQKDNTDNQENAGNVFLIHMTTQSAECGADHSLHRKIISIYGAGEWECSRRSDIE